METIGEEPENHPPLDNHDENECIWHRNYLLLKTEFDAYKSVVEVQLIVLEQRLENYCVEVESLKKVESENRSLARVKQNLEKENEALLKDQEETRSRYEGEIRSLMNAKRSLQQTYIDLQEQTMQKDSELESMNLTIQYLNSRIKALEEQLQVSQASIAAIEELRTNSRLNYQAESSRMCSERKLKNEYVHKLYQKTLSEMESKLLVCMEENGQCKELIKEFMYVEKRKTEDFVKEIDTLRISLNQAEQIVLMQKQQLEKLQLVSEALQYDKEKEAAGMFKFKSFLFEYLRKISEICHDSVNALDVEQFAAKGPQEALFHSGVDNFQLKVPSLPLLTDSVQNESELNESIKAILIKVNEDLSKFQIAFSWLKDELERKHKEMHSKVSYTEEKLRQERHRFLQELRSNAKKMRAYKHTIGKLQGKTKEAHQKGLTDALSVADKATDEPIFVNVKLIWEEYQKLLDEAENLVRKLESDAKSN